MSYEDHRDDHIHFLPPHEQTPLINRRRASNIDAESISAWTKESHSLASTTLGERLPYANYTTIDWLHELVRSLPSLYHFNPANQSPTQVKQCYRHRLLHSQPGTRAHILAALDAVSGWIAVSLIGILMALVAVSVDMSVATVAGLKFGYCSLNPLLSRETCCRIAGKEGEEGDCAEFRLWGGQNFAKQFGIYVGWAVAFGVVSSAITMLSRRELPAASPGLGDGHVVGGKGKNGNGGVGLGEREEEHQHDEGAKVKTKSMYMAAGSGIPEIKVRGHWFARKC